MRELHFATLCFLFPNNHRRKWFELLPEFEIALARGYDIEQTRRRLIDEARNSCQDQCQIIDHDAKIAELIVYALRQEPVWSPGYGVARGIQRRMTREHPEDDRLVRELRKTIWVDSDKPKEKKTSGKNQRRKGNDHKINKGTAETAQQSDGDERSGKASQASVSETISAES